MNSTNTYLKSCLLLTVRLTPKFFFAKTIKFILWSNVPQKFFDLVKSSNFCAPLKPSFVWFTTEHEESGESKAVTSLRERKLRLSQSDLLLCVSVEAFLPRTGFSLGLHSRQISVFINNIFYFVGFWNELWLRRLRNLLYHSTVDRFLFYQQYLLLRRILKWALTQTTPKFIISLKRMTTRTYQRRKVNN